MYYFSLPPGTPYKTLNVINNVVIYYISKKINYSFDIEEIKETKKKIIPPPPPEV